LEDKILSNREDRVEVTIITKHYQVKGEIFLYQGARLTDYMLEAKSFIAVSDAEVLDHENKQIFTTSFLSVNRDHIEIILPTDLINTE
jgi:hypothetical protein